MLTGYLLVVLGGTKAGLYGMSGRSAKTVIAYRVLVWMCCHELPPGRGGGNCREAGELIRRF